MGSGHGPAAHLEPMLAAVHVVTKLELDAARVRRLRTGAAHVLQCFDSSSVVDLWGIALTCGVSRRDEPVQFAGRIGSLLGVGVGATERTR